MRDVRTTTTNKGRQSYSADGCWMAEFRNLHLMIKLNHTASGPSIFTESAMYYSAIKGQQKLGRTIHGGRWHDTCNMQTEVAQGVFYGDLLVLRDVFQEQAPSKSAFPPPRSPILTHWWISRGAIVDTFLIVSMFRTGLRYYLDCICVCKSNLAFQAQT